MISRPPLGLLSGAAGLVLVSACSPSAERARTMAGSAAAAGGASDGASGDEISAGGSDVATGGRSGTGESSVSSGPGCSDPSTFCGVECVDLTSDPQNCGACGNACGPCEACTRGACASLCLACEGCTAEVGCEGNVAPAGPISMQGDVAQDGGACALGTVTFSMPVSPDITYAWTVPVSATIVSGQGTASIVVEIGVAAGQVCVATDWACWDNSDCIDVAIASCP